MSLPPFSPANALPAISVVLADARAFWLSLATERIVIDRVTSSEVDDEGREANTHRTVYDGPGLIDSFMSHEQSPDVGSSTSTVQRLNWQIPAEALMAGLVEAGIVATWDGPAQAGDRMRRMTEGKPVKTVRMTGEHDITHGVQQRLYVDEITGGVWS